MQMVHTFSYRSQAWSWSFIRNYHQGSPCTCQCTDRLCHWDSDTTVQHTVKPQLHNLQPPRLSVLIQCINIIF